MLAKRMGAACGLSESSPDVDAVVNWRTQAVASRGGGGGGGGGGGRGAKGKPRGPLTGNFVAVLHEVSNRGSGGGGRGGGEASGG